MKIGQHAWNKVTRKTGACLHPTRWSQRLDIAIAAAIITAVITWTESAIVIYSISCCHPCMWKHGFTIFWHRHEMNRMNHRNNWHSHGRGRGRGTRCSKSTRIPPLHSTKTRRSPDCLAPSRRIQNRCISQTWWQTCLLARWWAEQTAKTSSKALDCACDLVVLLLCMN